MRRAAPLCQNICSRPRWRNLDVTMFFSPEQNHISIVAAGMAFATIRRTCSEQLNGWTEPMICLFRSP